MFLNKQRRALLFLIRTLHGVLFSFCGAIFCENHQDPSNSIINDFFYLNKFLNIYSTNCNAEIIQRRTHCSRNYHQSMLNLCHNNYCYKIVTGVVGRGTSFKFLLTVVELINYQALVRRKQKIANEYVF